MEDSNEEGDKSVGKGHFDINKNEAEDADDKDEDEDANKDDDLNNTCIE